ncbi:ribonuclease H-like domain-containing protein, partial [Tanacetum coccineum]
MSPTAYVDVDHAGCQDTRHSTPGSAQFLGDKLVSWLSKKKNCTAISSTKAEYIALSSAIALCCNNIQHSRDMHIDVRYHFIKEQVKNGIATVSVHKSSIRFTINKKKVSLDVDMFREILQFFPKIPGQKFEDLPLEHDILSFIRDLGHTKDITYLTDVNVDYLHQPWIAFATVINKCLSGKETRMDKIHLLFQIENKDAKKTNKMSYPRFIKIIIDYFMSKDLSISRRNKMFWHTSRDDTMFTSMRCISRHEDTQVYGTILPKELTNQAMLESNAYKTYYAFASGEKAPKPKYVRKKADPVTSPKQNHVQASKDTSLKSKAKVAKSDKKKQLAKKPKAKGLAVLSEVALTEAEQLKLATKISKKDFHISHESGSCDGVDTQSKGDSKDKDDNDDDGDSNDHDDDSDDERTESDREEIPDPKKTNKEHNEEEEEYDDELNIKEEEKIDDEETMDEEEDDKVTKDLYDDVNQVEEDAHVTLTPVIDIQKTGDPTQSSSVSSDFTSKLLNLDNPSPSDNEIASLMVTTAQHATTILEISLHTTTSLLALPDFASVFKFNERVFNLEKDVSEIKKVDQYAQALSSIPAIVDHYMDNKLGEVINKAILAHNLDCRQEAQDEKNAYIELVDTSMRALIKEEKNVTKSVEAAVLARSSSQPTSTYETDASLSEFELTKILIDKMEKNKSYDKADYKKKLYDALVESYNTNKYLFDSYGEIFSLKRTRDDSDKDQDPFAGLVMCHCVGQNVASL